MYINWKKLSISIAIPLGVGLISAWLTRNSMDLYKTLKLPPLSPPGWLFPIVWTILFILMGISSYLIYISHNPLRQTALWNYVVQLCLNFIWTLIFFLMHSYTLSFIIIIILIYYILKMIFSFKKVNPFAGYLQIPYLLWVLFAAYLNLAISILN